MNKIMKFAFSLLLGLALIALPAAFTEAAAQPGTATLKLKVEVMDKDFWNCTFFAPDNGPSKPSAIRAEWSFGNMGKDPKTEIIVANGKKLGEISINAEKGSLINLGVVVKNDKNQTLGYWGMQLINKGQTETVIISLPAEIRPQFTRSNM